MASENSTTPVQGDTLNATAPSAPKPFTLQMLVNPQFLLVEVQVIFSALLIIWLGAHASIRRPPSAAPAVTKGKKQRPRDDQFIEGFVASDAIMLPIAAAAVLIGLYYLIEWLQDPDLLNKIIRVYLSIASILGFGRLAGDALNIVTSLVFPTMWADQQGNVYRIDAEHRCQVRVATNRLESDVPGKKTPFPSFLSVFSRSDWVNKVAWEVRHLLTEEWTVRFAVHGLAFVKFNIGLNNILGVLVSTMVSIGYHLTQWPMLSNLLGSALSYSVFSLMSPTSFPIGSMVLAGLFIYDIVMVFYTPFMITVATKVDAPIKLVFQSGTGVSMLGLGDIIVPGLLMALALRFDLYLYYLRKVKLEKVTLAVELFTGDGQTVMSEKEEERRVKAPWVDPQSQWGNRFWTTKFGHLFPVAHAESVWASTVFPKPYFYASIFGYALGMVVTITMLLVFNHGQPALLYLVPGVTGSLWLTALVRGELKEMRSYTEDGSLDTEDVIVEVDAEGNVEERKSSPNLGDKRKRADMKDTPPQKKASEDYDVFLFSITAPRHKAPKED